MTHWQAMHAALALACFAAMFCTRSGSARRLLLLGAASFPAAWLVFLAPSSDDQVALLAVLYAACAAAAIRTGAGAWAMLAATMWGAASACNAAVVLGFAASAAWTAGPLTFAAKAACLGVARRRERVGAGAAGAVVGYRNHGLRGASARKILD